MGNMSNVSHLVSTLTKHMEELSLTWRSTVGIAPKQHYRQLDSAVPQPIPV